MNGQSMAKALVLENAAFGNTVANKPLVPIGRVRQQLTVESGCDAVAVGWA